MTVVALLLSGWFFTVKDAVRLVAYSLALVILFGQPVKWTFREIMGRSRRPESQPDG
jgi:hypothetical protein